MSLTRFCGIYSPRRPDLLSEEALDSIIDAFPAIPGTERRRYADPEQGFGLMAVSVPYLGKILTDEDANWSAAEDSAVVVDGWLRPLEAGGPGREGTEAAEAVESAVRSQTPLEELAGEFAFAAWDGASGTLTLANDPQGRRSLFYHYDESTGLLLFASQASALLAHPRLSRKPSLEGLGLFLHDGYIPAPYTGFADIRKLRTGEVLTLGRDGRMQLRIPWRYPEMGDESLDIDHWAHVLAGEIRSTVATALSGHPSAGLFFSAGLDSTILANLVQSESSVRLRAYTAGQPPETRSHELDFPHARRLAEDWGIDQHELLLTPESIRPHLLPVLRQFDEPSVAAADAVTFRLILSRAANDGIGLGLTGYASGAFDLTVAGIRAAEAGLTRTDLQGELLDIVTEGRFFEDSRIEKLLTGPLPPLQELVYEAIAPLWEATPSEHIEHRISGSVRWARRRGIMFASAEHLQAIQTVQFRHPFGDWPSFRLSAVLPLRHRHREQEGPLSREVLQRAFADILPGYVLNREKRGLPGYVLSDHTFGALEQRLFSRETIEGTGLFKFDYLQKVIAKKQLRKLLMLYLLWHELHVRQDESILEAV